MFVLSLSYLRTQSDQSFPKQNYIEMLAKKVTKMPRRPRNRYGKFNSMSHAACEQII
jgi:hypothetical protein